MNEGSHPSFDAKPHPQEPVHQRPTSASEKRPFEPCPGDGSMPCSKWLGHSGPHYFYRP